MARRRSSAAFKALAALSLTLLASGASAQRIGSLPTRSDVALAYVESARDLCRALIDQCDDAGPTVPSSPDQIESLLCSGRATTATCRFRFGSARCIARFALRRSDGARNWVVERRPARFHGRPQVNCRD